MHIATVQLYNAPTTSPIACTARDAACRLLDAAGHHHLEGWTPERLQRQCHEAGRLARVGLTDADYYVRRMPEAMQRIGDAGRAAFVAGWDAALQRARLN